MREVESICGIDGIHISTHEAPLTSEKQAGSAAPEGFRPLRQAVATAARRIGAGTILTGQNGDLMMGNWYDDSLQMAGSLRHLRIGRAWNEALAWSKIVRRPVYHLLWRAFQAALPPALSPAGIYAVSDGSYAPESTETSLRPAPESLFSQDWMQAPAERRKHFRSLSRMLELRALQAPEPLQHLDYTHPFAHRPLVEFLMKVPADVVCGPGEPRRLMRAALSDLWPAKLRSRRSKASFGAPWQDALRPLLQTLRQSGELQVVERGFVDRASVHARLERLSAGLPCNESQLRQIILMEFWLRHRVDNGIHEEASRAA